MPPSEPRRHLFPNGFELVYQHTPAAPVLALDLWVRVGSSRERPTEAGLSHVVEHMLFKGTKRRGPGAVAREVESLGGEINAFTSFDHTVYTLALASRFGAEGVDILFDAATASRFAEEELEREKLVILEEVRRSRDIPHIHLSRLLFAEAYRGHPYGRPVIGTEESVKSFTRSDCLAFTRRWYRPGRMTLAAAGDLSFEKVLALVAPTFGAMSPRPEVRVPALPRLAGGGGYAFVAEPRDVTEAYFDLAFPGPSARHADAPAADLLLCLLGQGESSRLLRALKLEQNLVRTVGSGAYTPVGPGLLYVGGVADAGRMAEAFEALALELARLRRDAPGTREIQRAKEMLAADFLYQKETVQGVAQKLGHFHVVHGDLHRERTYLAEMEAVDGERLSALSRRWFDPERATLALLHPRGKKAPLTRARTKKLLEAAARRLHRPAKRPEIHRFELPGGGRLLVRPTRNAPVAAFRAAFLGGTIEESARQAGAFHLLAECLTRGTATRSLFDVGRDADRAGGVFEGFSGRNSFGLRGEFLSRQSDLAFELIADLLAAPAFPAEEVERAKEDQLAAIRRRDDSPASKAFRLFEKTLFGAHPYGRDILGVPESVAALTPAALTALYRQHARSERFALAFAGDVDPDHAAERMTALFSLPGHGKAKTRVAPAPDFPAKPRFARAPSPHEQVHVVVGFPGTDLNDPDRYALRVLNAMLSGQGGRLFRRLRDERGLAYSVFATSLEGVAPGYVAGYIATSPENAEAARAGLLSEMTALATGDFDGKEVEEAKRKLVGSFEIGMQENDFQAAQMALDEIQGLGAEHFLGHARRILSVTPEAALRVARRFLRAERHAAVIVGPEK